MKTLLTTAICVVALSACTKKEETTTETTTTTDGRYVGIGTYSPSGLWSRIVGTPAPEDKTIATAADDDQIIIVVDTKTGEIRQCGNMSGHCIGMNPWTKALAAEQQIPVALTERADANGKMVKIGPPEKTVTETVVTTPAR